VLASLKRKVAFKETVPNGVAGFFNG